MEAPLSLSLSSSWPNSLFDSIVRNEGQEGHPKPYLPLPSAKRMRTEQGQTQTIQALQLQQPQKIETQKNEQPMQQEENASAPVPMDEDTLKIYNKTFLNSLLNSTQNTFYHTESTSIKQLAECTKELLNLPSKSRTKFSSPTLPLFSPSTSPAGTDKDESDSTSSTSSATVLPNTASTAAQPLSISSLLSSNYNNNWSLGGLTNNGASIELPSLPGIDINSLSTSALLFGNNRNPSPRPPQLLNPSSAQNPTLPASSSLSASTAQIPSLSLSTFLSANLPSPNILSSTAQPQPQLPSLSTSNGINSLSFSALFSDPSLLSSSLAVPPMPSTFQNQQLPAFSSIFPSFPPALLSEDINIPQAPQLQPHQQTSSKQISSPPSVKDERHLMSNSAPAFPQAETLQAYTPSHIASPASQRSGQKNSEQDTGESTLLIEQQPTLKSVKKNSKLNPPFKVKANVDDNKYKVTGPVRACLISDSPSPIHLINATQELNPRELTATFTNLRFEDGSRQSFVQMYFELPVSTPDGRAIVLTSARSDPFIICTHTLQWKQSEQNILKKLAFGDLTTIAWDKFQQALDSHFQGSMGLKRTLAPDDIAYIHASKFNNTSVVTLTQFNEFWKWYGVALKSIFQKPGNVLWERGIIGGFMSQAKVMALLNDLPLGTAAVTFDESDGSLVANLLQIVNNEKKLVSQSSKGKQNFISMLASLSSQYLWRREGENPIVFKDTVINDLRPKPSRATSTKKAPSRKKRSTSPVNETAAPQRQYDQNID